MENRIISLETRLMFFEDTIKELNRTVLTQDKEIRKLQACCTELNRKIKELAEGEGSAAIPTDERPPHY